MYLQLFAQILLFFPEVFLSLSCLQIMVYGVLMATNPSYNFPIIQKNIYYLSLYVILFCFVLTLYSPVEQMALFSDTFVFDDIAYVSKLVLFGAAFFTLVLVQPYLAAYKVNNFEYFLLLLFSLLGFSLLVSSHDFLSVYLAIELSALSAYILAAFQRKSIFSSEAGLKYFIMGAFASGLLLFGFSHIYGFCGTTTFSEIAILNFSADFSHQPILEVAIVFVLSGILFKLAAFPLHMWSPDVYEGSPTSSTVFFALVPKIALISFLYRFLYFVFPSYSYFWGPLLLVTALGSIAVSSFGIFTQENMKRMLAFSSIGHVGFMLLPLACGQYEGITASALYAIIYTLSGFAVWGLLIGNMQAKNNFYLVTLSALNNTNPLLAFIGCLAFFSLAGIPPLVGFYSKLSVFFSAIAGSLYFAVLFALFLSLLSTYYYINLVKTLYFEKKREWSFTEGVCKDLSLTISVGGLVLFLFFLEPNLLTEMGWLMSLSLEDQFLQCRF